MFRAPEGGETAELDPHVAPAARAETAFSRQYVEDIRKEAKEWRLKAREHEEAAAKAVREAAEIKNQADAAEARIRAEAASEIEAKTTEIRTAAEARVIRAAMRSAAARAGMVDLDGLKLIDTSSLKVSDDNEDVAGADELIEATKKAKPWLFGSSSTSSTAAPPPAKPPAAKKASEMTDAEFAAALKNKSWRS